MNIHKCYYCERPFSLTLLKTKDHIIPKSKGGSSGPKNLLAACHVCNGFKGNYLPEDFVLLVKHVLDRQASGHSPAKRNLSVIVLQTILTNAERLVAAIEPNRKHLYKGAHTVQELSVMAKLRKEELFLNLLYRNTERVIKQAKKAKWQTTASADIDENYLPELNEYAPRLVSSRSLCYSLEDALKETEKHFHY